MTPNREPYRSSRSTPRAGCHRASPPRGSFIATLKPANLFLDRATRTVLRSTKVSPTPRDRAARAHGRHIARAGWRWALPSPPSASPSAPRNTCRRSRPPRSATVDARTGVWALCVRSCFEDARRAARILRSVGPGGRRHAPHRQRSPGAAAARRTVGARAALARRGPPPAPHLSGRRAHRRPAPSWRSASPRRSRTPLKPRAVRGRGAPRRPADCDELRRIAGQRSSSPRMAGTWRTSHVPRS